MENASKALIIAGAILLSILIIGLGMAVYNSASSSTGSADLSSQEVSAYNSKFLAYEGKISGTQAKSLITAIKSNNTTNEDKLIQITFDKNAKKAFVSPALVDVVESGVTEDPNFSDYKTWLGQIKSNSTYFVTIGYRDDGLVGGVDIHLYSQVDTASH